MYVSKYTVDILIVENTAKFGLYFLISPQIIQSSVLIFLFLSVTICSLLACKSTYLFQI